MKRERIVKYWKSKEARERLNKIKKVFDHYESDFQILLHDSNEIFCFACLNKFEAWHDLQRCHIVPRFLGGSNHPSNLILACYPCHRNNPHTKYERVYLMWLSLTSKFQKSKSFDLDTCLSYFDIDSSKVGQMYEENYDDFNKINSRIRDEFRDYGVLIKDIDVAGCFYEQSIKHKLYQKLRYK